MQPSELDRQILSPLPNNPAKKNRITALKSINDSSADSDNYSSNYLSDCSSDNPQLSNQTYSQDLPAQNISTGKDTEETDIKDLKKTDINPVEPNLDLDTSNIANGNSKAISSAINDDNDKKNLDSDGNGLITPEIDTEEIVLDKQQGFLPVLKNYNFLALWGGQVFCQLADKVYLVLMIALIKTQFQTPDQSISGWVSAIMIAFTIPAVLFGSVAGVFVDRWRKKTVLVATNILRGILVLGIPALLWFTHDLHPVKGLPVGFLIILGLTFLVSTLTQFFAPAEQSAIPLVVKEEHLLSANSLYTTTMMASVIVGFAVGEPLLAGADRLWLQVGGSGDLGKEIVVGGSYAIAGLILLLISTKEKAHENTTETPHVLADLRDGLRYLKVNPVIRNALIQLVILFSVFAALTVLAVRLAEIIPNLKAEQFGFLLASGGVGIAVGAIIVGQFGQRFSHAQLSLCGCIGMAASLIGLSLFSKELLMVLGFILLLGIFGALIAIPMQTAIQTQTSPEMRGKVFGLQNNVINIALSLPLALAGVAETFFGLQNVFLGLATIVFLGGALTWYKSPD
ncbi:MFS transporter [Brunnivagina elsteri]|uniref:MFS transporter n=1 Tax=Brunnivagina elsteri CCALA 953 TaxID=987040 RepID=A0A2A2TH91_9CYAN|nr:MFS transporter [Calothrix elsteri]PAX52995.1 MFS transporter [Calothrix elsteri CCALA 953]